MPSLIANPSNTKPTNTMIQLLLQENLDEEKESDRIFEFEQRELIAKNEELGYYRNQYFTTKTNYNGLKNYFETVFKKINTIISMWYLNIT